MISKYNEFLFESMILESKLVFSNRLINLLNSMPESNIKDKILNIIRSNTDLNLVQNFFDISDSKEEITFIQDRRAQQLLNGQSIKFKTNGHVNNAHLTFNKKVNVTTGEKIYTNQIIFDALGFDADSVDHDIPSQGQIGEIIAETPSRITPDKIYVLFKWGEKKMAVLNKKSVDVHDDKIDRVWALTRNPIRIGRAIKSILTISKIDASDKEIEDFINTYKSAWDIMNDAFLKFDVVKGNDISYWYNSEVYEDPDRSTLGNSCMANVESSYFDIYVNNPNVCQLVILYSDNGKIIDGKWKSKTIKGRAILWKTNEGDMFMDRVYYNYESDADLFKKFAERNGWWCKRTQDSGSDFTAQLGNQTKKPIYTISLDESVFDYYPYVDTMSYINFYDKKMSNDTENMTGDLCGTGGEYDRI